ncbi:MAG: SpoIIE family protein phosphatase [Acidobacteriales bacterium]|nr:SpoIIE family protein phosphatase [Terriglobales bacterium]
MAKSKPAKKDYIDTFAGIVSTFASLSKDDLLATVPAMIVENFEADRAELWLWDDGTQTAYLVHSAGTDATHRQEFTVSGKGAVGKVAEILKQAENLSLASFGGDDQEFAKKYGLTHISCYPLLSNGRLTSIMAIYGKHDANESLLAWWRMYAEMCSLKVQQIFTTEEQKRQITQLSLLFEATRLLNSTLDLAELLELILKIARTEVNADRGSVFLVDHQHSQLWSIVASGLDHQEIRIPFGGGVAGRVAQTGEIINTEDAYTLPFFEASFDQKFGYRTRSLLSLPIRHHTGQVVGVLQLLNKLDGPRFSPDDEDFLVKLSGHMAMALENAQLHRDQLIKQRLEKELALARTIQQRLLPDHPPVVPGYEIAVRNEPCFEVGGDYYDFLALGPHTLLLVIADVEGKGVSSAMVMSNLQATLRALVMHLHSLEVLATSLNEMIHMDTKSEKYLSCFLGLVDTRRGGLHYINAGHVPPILVRADGTTLELEEGGTVVGLFPKAEYNRGAVSFRPGDVLLLCTDGITEAADLREVEYGRDRLLDCVRRNQQKPAQGIVDAVLKEVLEHSRGNIHTDDKVLIIFKVASDGSFQGARIGSLGPDGTERRADPR